MTVTTGDVESYFSKESKKDLSKIFDQYLRTTKIPQLEYKISGDNISYRWTNTVSGFAMPVRLSEGSWLYPSTEWRSVAMTGDLKSRAFEADKNFYITVKKVQ